MVYLTHCLFKIVKCISFFDSESMELTYMQDT